MDMQCIQPQSETAPERILSNPWYDRGFCDPDQYRAAIARCKSGVDACEQFIGMFEQRVMIERDYVAAIRKWSAAAEKKIVHSAEFGTNRRTWLHSIQASELIAKTHDGIAEGIQHDVVDKMKSYERENYDISIFHIRTVTEFEKEFEKLQKPWLKLLDKLEQAEKSYHKACLKLKKAESVETIIKSDKNASKEQITNATDAANAYNTEMMGFRYEYQRLFDEMVNSRPAYENSMKEILNRLDDIERRRLNQFKLLLNAYHDAVNIERDHHLTEMSTSMKKAIELHDTEKDLHWWHQHYANDAHNSWRVFEDPRE